MSRKRGKSKHPRLRNGMGSIKYLGKGRRNPYAVYPPEYKISEDGKFAYKRALCYVPDWTTGFAVLIAYRTGQYHPGDELLISGRLSQLNKTDLKNVLQFLLSGDGAFTISQSPTKHRFSDVCNQYLEERFGSYAYEPFSEGTLKQYKSAIKAWHTLNDAFVEDILTEQLQQIVNEMAESLARNSLKLKIAVCQNIFNFSCKKGYIKKSPASGLRIPLIARAEVHALPYDRDELKQLWLAEKAGNDVAGSILIQIYSGFRVSAFFNHMIVDLEQGVFIGGVKSRDHKPRQVPIHPAIRPIVEQRLKEGKQIYFSSPEAARIQTRNICLQLGIRDHTTHSARHTFKMLCDRYGVHPVAQRILMGHSTKGEDIHDAVYSHFELEDLKAEISKIVADCC